MDEQRHSVTLLFTFMSSSHHVISAVEVLLCYSCYTVTLSIETCPSGHMRLSESYHNLYPTAILIFHMPSRMVGCV